MAGRAKRANVSNWTKTRIRALRDSIGETQQEFAARFRVTVDSIRHWEQGTANPAGPSTVVMDYLAKQFGFEQSNGHATLNGHPKPKRELAGAK